MYGQKVTLGILKVMVQTSRSQTTFPASEKSQAEILKSNITSHRNSGTMPMNESALILIAFQNRLKSNTPYKQIQPLSRIRTLNGPRPRVRGISQVANARRQGGQLKQWLDDLAE